MQKFQTRISFVDALRWSDHLDFCHEGSPIRGVIEQQNARTFVVTPEGHREIRAGDWLIRDPAGTFMPMSNEMFVRKYEPVKSSALTEQQTV